MILIFLGLLKECARRLFHLDLKFTIIEHNQEKRNDLFTEHVTFKVESCDETISPKFIKPKRIENVDLKNTVVKF